VKDVIDSLEQCEDRGGKTVVRITHHAHAHSSAGLAAVPARAERVCKIEL
jgi:hypothetical protein